MSILEQIRHEEENSMTGITTQKVDAQDVRSYAPDLGAPWAWMTSIAHATKASQSGPKLAIPPRLVTAAPAGDKALAHVLPANGSPISGPKGIGQTPKTRRA